MTASLEANVEAMKLYMRQAKGVSMADAELISVQCSNDRLIGEVLTTAMIDGAFRSTVVVIGLIMQPDGTIAGEVLGAREVGAEDAKE